MNLELIRKYLPEFNSYVKGQPLLIGFKRSDGAYKWKPLVLEDWENGLIGDFIVINDEYCTYRKALAEGRHIQFFNTKERLYDSSKPLHTWQYTGTIRTHGIPSDYRIKPEEHDFKVGDYVRYIHAN